jgi:hypothetical protein
MSWGAVRWRTSRCIGFIMGTCLGRARRRMLRMLADRGRVLVDLAC